MKPTFSVCKILSQHLKRSIKLLRLSSSLAVNNANGVKVNSKISNKNEVVLDYETLDDILPTRSQPPLEPCKEDISGLSSYFPDTFNVAAYINKSETLQNLVKLDVDLSKIEKRPFILQKLLRLDFERDMKQHLFFLKDYVPESNIGLFLTKNPMIFTQSLEDMQVRINYLESKRFQNIQVKRIIDKNPFWLMFSTLRIDKRLGFFQQQFNLSGNQVRHVTVKQPRLITYNMHHIKMNTFSIKEEFGFTQEEIVRLLMDKPKLWMMEHMSLVRRFNYLHNKMKIPHEHILEFPEALLCRVFKMEQRHTFLEKLGRAQYNPKIENYVSPKALVEGTDVEFCTRVAKCNVDDFNLYLKTM